MPLAAPLRARRRRGLRAALPAMAVMVLAVTGLAACGGGDDDTADAATFCLRLERLAENDPFLAFGDTATPGEIRTAFTALRERSQELVEVAPPEARAAARDYRDAVQGLDDVLAEADYGTDVDARTYRDHQGDYVEASQRLERYLAAECGVDDGSTTSTTG